MMKCITCSQSLPEGMEEHPGYFARVALKPEADDVDSFSQEVEQILGYIETLFIVLSEAKGIDESRLFDLHMLGWDLTEEAKRHLGKVLDAAEVWRKRVEANGKTHTQQPDGEGKTAPSDEKGETKVVRAERFEVVDKRGRIRAVLGQLPDDETGLRLFNDRGNEQATFCLQKGDPYLYFTTGNVVLDMGLKDGLPFINLCDGNGGVRLKIEMDDEDTPAIVVLDADDKAVLILGADESKPFVQLCDNKGGIRLELDVDKKGTPTIVTRDSSGRETWRAPAEGARESKG